MRRAVEVEPSNAKKPVARLLNARILLYADRLDEAHSLLASITAHQEHAREEADADALFEESYQILYEMTQMVLLWAPWEEWQSLRARAERVSEVEELAELIEMGARVELHRGRHELAVQLFEEALAVCRRTPHIIEERIKKQLDLARRALQA